MKSLLNNKGKKRLGRKSFIVLYYSPLNLIHNDKTIIIIFKCDIPSAFLRALHMHTILLYTQLLYNYFSHDNTKYQ